MLLLTNGEPRKMFEICDPDVWVTIAATETHQPPVDAVLMDLTLRVMGDKSPKATHKHAVQKQVKADAARQEKNKAASAKQVPKTKK
jgi:hypothetical protein